MNFKLWTRYAPCMIKVVVKTSSPQTIALKVFDPSQANTVFTDRTKEVNGTQELFVRMPLAPNTAQLSVYNEKNGNLPKGSDSTFEVVKIEKEELDITLPQTKMDTFSVRNFVGFAQKFAYNSGWVAAPRDYMSSGDMTVPMRMAILLHEYSHFYLNSDIANETEADLNGLTIYLGLGYPIREAYEAFAKTFIGYPSEQNKQRYDIINRFIREYIEEYKLKDVYATG